MGLTLTYRYSNDKSVIYPFFIYYYKGKKTKLHSGVSCKSNHWNTLLKKVERGDKDYKLKNIKINTLKSKIENIINQYSQLDEPLLPKQIRIELEQKLKLKEVKTLSNLPLYNLLEEWRDDYLKNELLETSTRTKAKSIISDLLLFIKESENERILLVDDLDDDFNRRLVKWCFSKPIKVGVKENGEEIIQIGLRPNSVEKRFRYLQQFCKWYSKQTNIYTRIDLPKQVSKSQKVEREKEPLCFFQNELEKLYNFNEFNYLEKRNKNGEIVYLKNDKWKKYLNTERRNSDNLDGVVEFIYENTNYGLQTYTSWEVYLDILVFLCSVGCRWSDVVELKLNNFKHEKRDNNSPLKDNVEAFFVFQQKKTKTQAIPRVNEISFEIYKKYSRGKSKDDYLFPRTNKGNPIYDVHFNKHIKRICKIVGLNRKIVRTRIGNKGEEIERFEKKLWELVSSHIGRKTFIKTLIVNKDYSTREIMRQTGHLSDRVFNKYYSIEKRDILNKANPLFLKKQNNYKIESDIKDVDEIKIDKISSPQKLSQNEKLEKLKNDFKDGILDKSTFELLYSKVILE